MMRYLGQVWAIVRKDLAVERRSRELLTAMFVFALTVICAALVTDRMRPGTIMSYEASAKYDPLEPGKPGSPDRGGCMNQLTPMRMVSSIGIVVIGRATERCSTSRT